MTGFVDRFGMTEWRTALKIRDEAPLAQALRVSKTYTTPAGPVHALNEVSLELAQGEFSCVVGPSGSGKSTLIHLLAGLIRPTKGKVLFKGLDLNIGEESVRRLIREEFIGVVPQDVNLLRYLTARENVELPMEMIGVGRRETHDRSSQLLEQLGLGDRGDHRPSELSMGEQKRVTIARALTLNPALVLVDEPTANLDSETAKKVIDIMIQERDTNGRTFLFVTHDPVMAGRCDRVLSIRDGVVSDTTTAIAEEIELKPLAYFTTALFDRLATVFAEHLTQHSYKQGDRVTILDTSFEIRAPGLGETRFLVPDTAQIRMAGG